jgi:hypothetical protein
LGSAGELGAAQVAKWDKITLGFKHLAGPAVDLFYAVPEKNHAQPADPAPRAWFDSFDRIADRLVSSYIEFCDEAANRKARN